MRGKKGVLFFVFLIVILCASYFLFPLSSRAAINQQINFQGKLTNPDGTNVANNPYSIRFRIYTDPSLDAANACAANTCQWEETQGSVLVTDGIFSVSLGSSTALPGNVNFDSNALYLGVKVGADAEMTPRIRLTAAPYAFNSSQLGGVASGGFVQLGQISGATGQTDNSNNPSIFINKTSGTGNILELQKTASDVFVINNGGNISATGTYNSNTFTNNSLQFGATSAATIQSAASQALNITGNAASTVSTSTGNLTIQAGSGTVSLGSSTVLTASGALSINSASGSALTLDSGGAAALNIGTGANAKTISIGNTTGATAVANIVGTGTNVFNIQGAASSVYVQLDTLNNRLYVGNPTADATALVFVFDNKNTPGDPGSPVEGSEYYNSADGKLRCYENGYWSDCMTTRYLGGTVLGSAAATISVPLAANVEYLHCRLDIKGRSAASMPYLRFNNVSGAASYSWNAIGIVAAAGTDWQDSSDSEIQLSGTQTGTNPFSADILITNFSDTNKVVDWSAAGIEPVGTNSNHYDGTGGFYLTGSQISSVQFLASTGNFSTGSRAWCEGR